MIAVDAIVIGAGIAGAGIAAGLSRDRCVALVDMEDHAGAHATGRSAAVYSELYGNAVIQRLTRASKAFFEGVGAHRDDGTVFARPRACLYVASEGQRARLERFIAQPGVAERIDQIDELELHHRIPALRQGTIVAGVAERDARDLDVDAIHQHFLGSCRASGGVLHLSERVTGLSCDAGTWTVTTTNKRFCAPLVVNAAGAWGDAVARLAGVRPVGLGPRRRTVALVDLPSVAAAGTWPMVVDIDEQFYFKSEAGKLLISPCDETLVEPHDAYPEELDVAIAVDRVQTILDLPVRRISHSWAGLRTFAPDRIPIIGYDDQMPSFFWLVGQGGYGIQTIDAASRLAASLIRGAGVPMDLADAGLAASDVAPARPGLRRSIDAGLCRTLG